MGMTMTKMAVLCAVVLAACGGKQKQGPDMPTPDESNEHAETPPDQSASMVPSEKQDEIFQDLKRKGNTVSRCLSIAMEAGDVPKSTKGHITFEVVVDPSGHAGSVKVIKSEIQNDGIVSCATKKIQEIDFPQIPSKYETSITYMLEAN